MMLQPFANFEGWPQGSIEREDAFARAKGWISIMKVVGTDLLQVSYLSPCRIIVDPKLMPLPRSEQQTPPKKKYQRREKSLSPIYANWANYSQRATSASHTRTGAGQHTLRAGRKYGRLYATSTSRMSVSVSTRSNLVVVNGETRLHLRD